MIKEIKKISQDLLAKMLIEAEVGVTEVEGGFKVVVDSIESGILIGRGGETMRSLETILRLLVNKKMGMFVNLSLDIAGYKDKRKIELEEVAVKAAESAVRTNQVQLLAPMNSYERRLVHLSLAARDDIETESMGEEPDRRVMIKAKGKVLI